VVIAERKKKGWLHLYNRYTRLVIRLLEDINMQTRQFFSAVFSFL
jgi:hypothetical protein